ncbi:hypothetical protein BC828DRAFT_379047 [Blastocladiella britannica]|nr:hypothetical protein BC828DRAFT_379047 [Blastocladiella britannica]
MLEWWHTKCAEYGEPWAPLYLSPLALTGSTDVLDWAWDHGSRWLDFKSYANAVHGRNIPTATPSGIGMYPVAMALAKRGSAHVLEWLWRKSLMAVVDLKETFRRAVIIASQHGNVQVLSWYHAKLAIHDRWNDWRLQGRFLRQTMRTEDVRVAQWWFTHCAIYEERILGGSPLYFTLAGCIQGLEWLYAQGRLKTQYSGPLGMLLQAHNLGTFWFWIRYCSAHPDHVTFYWYFYLIATVRPIHLEIVWNMFEQQGRSPHNMFQYVLDETKDRQLAGWWKAKLVSLDK